MLLYYLLSIEDRVCSHIRNFVTGGLALVRTSRVCLCYTLCGV